MKICVLGSLNTDIVVQTQKYPQRGETIFGKSRDFLPGGKGGNAATAISRLEKDVFLIGAVGNDAFGENLISQLKDNGINTAGIKRSELYATGTAIIMIDEMAENTMLVVPGANQDLTIADVEKVLPELKKCDVLLTQMETSQDAIIYAMQKAQENGILVILDPAPAEGVTMKALQYADIIIPNEQETKYMTGIEIQTEDDAYKAALYFQSLGIPRVIIKMGHRGCLVFTPEKWEFIAAIPVKAVDTVVGDTYSGALTCALASGKDLFQAAKYASVVSALRVTRLGAQIGVPTKKEVNRFIEERQLHAYLESL